MKPYKMCMSDTEYTLYMTTGQKVQRALLKLLKPRVLFIPIFNKPRVIQGNSSRYIG